MILPKSSNVLGDIFRDKSRAEWIEMINKGGVPCAPIQTLNEVFYDPQVLFRKMVHEIDHPSAGKIKVVGCPIKTSSFEFSVRLSPPTLGQNTDEILANIGYTKDEVAKLRQDKIV